MVSFISLFILFAASLVNCDVENVNLLVELDNGVVRGQYVDGQYYSFMGIPYADPPLGERRFEPATLYSQKWDGIRDATIAGSDCLQWDHLSVGKEQLGGAEDCLFVNVLTPNPKAEVKLPVLVYIHGGAFMFGSGQFYSLEKFTSHSFVGVTLNYRLGPLGFLSTEDEVVPGNMGMKDQVLALKWVQKNIARFGGDPDNVTISGYSAGGASVQLHYLSPLSTDLFHRGIAHSGSALNPWVFAEDSGEKARRIATELGCPTCCHKKMIKCLKEKSAEEIVRLVPLFQTFLYNPFSPFGLVVENFTNENTFLGEKPRDILTNGNYQKLPIIMSSVEHEGLYPVAEFFSNETYLKMIEQEWNAIIPAILDYNGTADAERRDEISQKIYSEYMNTLETKAGLTRLVTDRLYMSNLGEAARLQGKHSPVYFYYFRYNTEFSISNYLSHTTEDFGVCHGDDISLIYMTILRETYNTDEAAMASKFMDMYSTFQSGVPSFGDIPMEPLDSEDQLKYLEVNDLTNIVFKTGDDMGNYKFWKSLGLNE